MSVMNEVNACVRLFVKKGVKEDVNSRTHTRKMAVMAVTVERVPDWAHAAASEWRSWNAFTVTESKEDVSLAL